MTEQPTMRAVRFHEYGEPSVLHLEEAPRPAPGEGQVLVAVRAAGVNPMEWKVRSGMLQAYMPLQLPHVPGYDVAGVVAETGPGVTDFASGDEVFGRGEGGYAEYAVVPAGNLARKPASLSFEEAATLPIGGVTAWLGVVETAQAREGMRLLIHGGAGGVGAIAVQLAKDNGAHVITTTSTANVEFVRSLGADEVIDYTTTRFEDTVHDVDVVYDTVGGEVLERSWGVLKRGGMLIEIAGMASEDTAREHGVRLGEVRRPEQVRPILEELVQLIETGRLKVTVGQVLPLEEASQAHATSQAGHGRGRIVLKV